MHLYRIVQPQYADLSGAGGLRVSGRWHSQGRAVVYLASSPSLAVLEVLGHTDSDILPPAVLLTVEVPDHMAIEEIDAKKLPAHWRDVPPPIECQKIGEDWLQRSETCLLWVPSVHVPYERNALFNPTMEAAKKVTILKSEPFEFDRRL